jgi:hypothetical protein
LAQEVREREKGYEQEERVAERGQIEKMVRRKSLPNTEQKDFGKKKKEGMQSCMGGGGGYGL